MTPRRLVYVDTSLLAKRYLREPDSTTTIGFLKSVVIATSSIAILELTAALHAANRSRSLSPARLQAALRVMASDCLGWYRLNVSGSVIEKARDIVSAYPLRSIDAIHCASGLILNDAQRATVPFATSDRRQRFAASALGLECLEVTAPAD